MASSVSNPAPFTRPHPHKSVLYVEDQPANVLLMRAIFERRPDYRLVVAVDGESGLRAAGVFRPDLLLLDLNLPDCLGTELLLRLRQLRPCAHLPAVVVTADHGFEIRGTGFCELWRKPLSLTETLQRLPDLLHDHTQFDPAATPWLVDSAQVRRGQPAARR